MIRIRFFGGASLEDGDGAYTGPATQRHRLALLALLAVAQPRGMSRERLTACLWPERDSAHARNLLNQAVHALRRALGEYVIVSMGDEVRLDGGAVDCDVIAFEAAVAEGKPARADELYAGPFLDGFSLPNATEFEQWADGERERLRQAYCRALDQLAREAAAADPPLAANFWRRLAAEEPYNTQVAVGLMEALERAGDRVGAIQHARLHAIRIRQEFEAEPDLRVLQLAERLRNESGRETRASAEASDPLGDAPRPAASRDVEASAGPAAPPQGRSTPGRVIGPGGSAAGEGSAVAPVTARARATPARRLHVAAIAGVVVLALALAGWLAVKLRSPQPAGIQRIAVLPLANLTGDAGQDAFVAALHDALVAEIASIDVLTVYSRQSVLRYVNSEASIPEIARELRADALLTGAVFISGDSVRITAQLFRAHPEGHIWAGVVHGTRRRAFALQTEVARDVAHAIRVRFDRPARPLRFRDRVPAAQQAYVAGLYHLERAVYGQILPPQERLAELRLARERLEDAVALDSVWATAYAKLALTYHWLASSGTDSDHEAEFYPKSKMAALRAIEIDELEAQAHASLGFVLFAWEWDWRGAERAIRRAVELDPNSHHAIYAHYLNAAGRHDDALVHYGLAQERNPLSEMLQVQTANAYACAGKYAEAVARVDVLESRTQAAAHVPGSVARAAPYDLRALFYSMAERHADAVPQAEAAVLLSDSLPGTLANLAFVLARAGRLDEARALADRIQAYASGAGAWRLAHLYASLGDTARALEAADALAARRRANRALFRCQLVYQLLSDHPRMQQLLQPVGYPTN